MRPFTGVLIISTLFYSCATVPVAKQTDLAHQPTKTEMRGNYDQTWTKIITYFSKKGYTYKNSNKKNGLLVYELKNAHISYREKDGSIKDSLAFAITDVRQKINNMVYVYPSRGTVECQILVEKKNSKLTNVYLSINPKGIITTYTYNTFEINKDIENVDVSTTGVCEKRLATGFVTVK